MFKLKIKLILLGLVLLLPISYASSNTNFDNLILQFKSDNGGLGHLIVSPQGVSVDFKRLKSRVIIISPKWNVYLLNYSTKKFMEYNDQEWEKKFRKLNSTPNHFRFDNCMARLEKCNDSISGHKVRLYTLIEKNTKSKIAKLYVIDAPKLVNKISCKVFFHGIFQLPSEIANLGIPVKLEVWRSSNETNLSTYWDTFKISNLANSKLDEFYKIPHDYTLAKTDVSLIMGDETTNMLNDALDSP